MEPSYFLLHFPLSLSHLVPFVLLHYSSNLYLTLNLFDGGAVANSDQIGWTALIFAAWKNHAECVRQLIDAGADKELKDAVSITLNAPTLFVFSRFHIAFSS